MTTILEAGMHCNATANMTTSEATAIVKNEPNYDTVRQTLREAIR